MSHPLLHPDTRLVIAHRGGLALAPENTIEAIERSLAAGADGVEFDVRVTRDGVPVLLHDATLTRTTGEHRTLADVSASDLAAVDASWSFPEWAGRTAVPTLEEVLDRFRRAPFVIEIKEFAAAEPVVRLVQRFAAAQHVVLASERTDVVDAVRAHGVATCASRAEATRLLPWALAGLTPRPPAYRMLSIPPWYAGWPIPMRRMAAAARRLGIPMHVWTVNEPATAVALWRAGVSGIVTDDPAAMIRARAG